MSVSLQKGQKVSLSKEGKEGLNRVIVGLGWDEAQPQRGGGLFGGLFSAPTQSIDCDASALLLQNGKLVGAVTHVLVNDPTQGYGILAETMLNTAQSSV